MLIRRRKKEDADDIVTRVGDYNNAAALNYEPRDIGSVPPDYGVLFVVFSLMLLGCLMVFSASISLGDSPKYHISEHYFFVRHVISLIVALFGAYIVWHIPMKAWKKMAFPFFLFGLFLLGAVFIPGVGKSTNGACRWIPLGLFNLQVTEVMKIAVLIYAADFTVRKQNYMHSVKKGLLPMLLVMGLVGFLVLKEPDLGAYVMMLAISMGILFLGGGSTVTIAQRMFEGMNSFALLAIPLYTFAGFTMSKGGISKRLMDFCYSIVGHIYGGLAHVNVLSSMIFAGISGSAVADTAGVSGMFMPEMIRKGYSKNFTVAVTAISSTIGIIIPPSIPMVVIAGICGISTGKLFLGGIIPGILCGLAQMIVSYFLAKKEGVPKEPGHFTIGPVLHGLWESWPALLMPIIIVGTITMGIVSPTEAGVIAVVYGLFAGGIIYRELKWEDIKFAFAETVRTSGRIFIVIGAAKLYTVMLTTAGFDKWVAKTMLGFSTNPTVILIMILLIFFIVTMFMESIATLTLFMPILYPIALGVGINPIVLSVLITVVIGVGLVTPPVGMCIYVACDLMDVTVGEVFPTLVPFIAATFVCIALMVAFPQLILLPTYLMA